MRSRIAIVLATLLLPTTALAYPRVPKTKSFGSFVHRMRRAAAHGDTKAIARATTLDFTVGEELARAPSLIELRNPVMLSALVGLLDRGVCYRTGKGLVQCELPDPGPNLEHRGPSLLGIFQRTKHGWKMGVFVSP
jgi:hypothetical protein